MEGNWYQEGRKEVTKVFSLIKIVKTLPRKFSSVKCAEPENVVPVIFDCSDSVLLTVTVEVLYELLHCRKVLNIYTGIAGPV